MDHAHKRNGRWVNYALIAGFVLVSSGAAVPRISASASALVERLGALFS
jgi:hypothetical protein